MPKLPILSGEEIVKALRQFGFEVARQRGSHLTMKKEILNGSIGCVIPMHKEVAMGTLRSILKQAQIDTDDFITVARKV